MQEEAMASTSDFTMNSPGMQKEALASSASAADVHEAQARCEGIRAAYRQTKITLAEAARDYQAAKAIYAEAEQALEAWPKEVLAAARLLQEAEVLLKFTEYLHETPGQGLDDFMISVARHTGDLDDSLKSGMSVAFATPPAQRGVFDKLVVDQVTERISKRIDDLRRLVHQDEIVANERKAAVLAAEAPLKAAQIAQTVAARAYTAATGDLNKAEVALQALTASCGA
jgi:hypothetical protein